MTRYKAVLPWQTPQAFLYYRHKAICHDTTNKIIVETISNKFIRFEYLEGVCVGFFLWGGGWKWYLELNYIS